MASTSIVPIPGMPKMVSMMTVPPRAAPALMPMVVTSERLDGRRAWRNRMDRFVRPLALAMPM
jgi:hypothetical protein